MFKKFSPGQDKFSQTLKETAEYFQSQNLSILGEGHRDIIADEQFFNEYVEKLTECASADDAAVIQTMASNCRMETLSESVSSGITPVSSLSLPILVKTWPRLAMGRAVPVEAAETPKFTLQYLTPWLKDKDGVKHELPQAISEDTFGSIASRLAIHAGSIAVPSQNFDVLSPVGASAVAGDSIDVDLSAVSVEIEVKNSAGASPETKNVSVDLRMDTQTGLVFGEVVGTHTDGTVTKDTLFVVVKRGEGLVSPSSAGGAIKSVKLRGFVSSEMYTYTEEVGFDLNSREINIPTGTPISAPVPANYLTDLLRMFNIDGVSKVVDLMSNTLAQAADVEGIQFLRHAQTDPAWVRSFDVHPSQQYMGSPSEWRSEIRMVIDNLAQTIQNQVLFNIGYFVVLGNPLDMQLIPNITWEFSSSSEEVSGVRVDYSVGSATGAHQFLMVSSTNVKAGSIMVYYIPTTPDQMTFKMYPYSFNVHPAGSGYNSPKAPNVPSIMANRRYTYEKMVPAIGKITILNNNGTIRA